DGRFTRACAAVLGRTSDTGILEANRPRRVVGTSSDVVLGTRYAGVLRASWTRDRAGGVIFGAAFDAREVLAGRCVGRASIGVAPLAGNARAIPTEGCCLIVGDARRVTVRDGITGDASAVVTTGRRR